MTQNLQAWHELAQQLRVDSIRSTTAAGSGHPTSSMSAADLMAVLMSKYLKYDFQPTRTTQTTITSCCLKDTHRRSFTPCYKAAGCDVRCGDAHAAYSSAARSRVIPYPLFRMSMWPRALLVRACPLESASRWPASISTSFRIVCGC